LVGILTLHLTELPHLQTRREGLREAETKEENVNGRRPASERADFWEPVCGVYCVG
jgi:hypothetical protein